MFCSKCGNKINDGDKFCSKCGNRMNESTSNLFEFKKLFGSQNTTQSQTQSRFNKNDYELFEVFSTQSLFGGASHFIITDRSIIHENVEYSLSQITAILLPNLRDVFVTRTAITTVDNRPIELKFSKEDEYRLCKVVIETNSKINLRSIKEKVKYAVSLQRYIQYLIFSDLSHFIPMNEHNQHEKILRCSLWNFLEHGKSETVDYFTNLMMGGDETQFKNPSPTVQRLIDKAKELENRYNNFVEDNNLLQNKECTIEEILKHIEDSDVDTTKAIERCLEKKRQEEIRREQEREHNIAMREAGYDTPSSNGSSLLGDIAKTAIGVALGNKMSQGRRTESKYKDFMGTAGCMYGRKKDGWTVHCDISCPLYGECSRGRGR